MIRFDKLPFFCIPALALLNSAPAQAFKLDTHLWIGQQVINDLELDRRITVSLSGRPITLPVPDEVASAVLAHRNEYLLGNIGPDAIPDVVVGQTLVHPGREEGWKTNDWLEYLLAQSRGNPLGLAFAHGYLGHAAADVFAHTYVNQYAGDIFALDDGETLVEQRHIALESFISRFTPPFTNASGRDLGPAWSLVQPSDAFASFVRDT
ncbi:MAG TPA: zinc dependent phospholipase C family protein, partial [Polyangiaceae bacterium]|nr:zinc dependent phospholipase C family protein [Polyangiaceae bacterium]